MYASGIFFFLNPLWKDSSSLFAYKSLQSIFKNAQPWNTNVSSPELQKDFMSMDDVPWI